MIYYLAHYLQEQAAGTEWADALSVLRVFRYITVRSAGAALTALLLSLWLGPRMIAWLKELKFGQNYRDRAEEQGDLKARILSKKGTPTMGGLMIVLVLDFTALLWTQWNELVVLTLLSVVVLAGLGFYDDYAKITRQSSAGATSVVKLTVQTTLALFIGVYLWRLPATATLITEVHVPFFKHPVLTGAGLAGLAVAVLTIVGSSNAVNLTDGLDGLASGLMAIAMATFAAFAYAMGRIDAAQYLGLFYLRGAGELTVFCTAIVGACLGFLWFNTKPAQIFMGDTGSLALGGALGSVAILLKSEFLVVFIGGVFVAETMSVLIQRSAFKWRKRQHGLEYAKANRVFLRAPLHHHFELKGWPESQVVVRFWIIGILCAFVALSTMKLR